MVALTDSDGFIWPMPNIFYAVQSHSIPTVSDSYYYLIKYALIQKRGGQKKVPVTQYFRIGLITAC